MERSSWFGVPAFQRSRAPMQRPIKWLKLPPAVLREASAGGRQASWLRCLHPLTTQLRRNSKERDDEKIRFQFNRLTAGSHADRTGRRPVHCRIQRPLRANAPHGVRSRLYGIGCAVRMAGHAFCQQRLSPERPSTSADTILPTMPSRPRKCRPISIGASTPSCRPPGPTRSNSAGIRRAPRSRWHT